MKELAMREATFPERRQAQRIAKSLKSRYGTARSAELLGISKHYFSGVVTMYKRPTSSEGQINYYTPHKIIFHVLEKARGVVLG